MVVEDRETPHLTDEEHKARAMLLGCDLYKKKGGYYTRWSTGPMGVSERFDALSLEPISIEEARRRNAQADKTGKNHYD